MMKMGLLPHFVQDFFSPLVNPPVTDDGRGIRPVSSLPDVLTP